MVYLLTVDNAGKHVINHTGQHWIALLVLLRLKVVDVTIWVDDKYFTASLAANGVDLKTRRINHVVQCDNL